MRTNFAFPARIEPDGDGRYLVTFPDLPEALTDGATQAEAREQASGALGAALMERARLREAIPEPSAAGAGLTLVHPSAQVVAKIALNVLFSTGDVSAAELGRRMRLDPKEVWRILNPEHQTKLPRLERALAALGHHLEVSVKPDRRRAGTHA